MVSHFVLISGPGGVGFRRKESAIGKKNHSQHVWNHDPVIGVDIHLRIPAEHRLRIISAKEEVVPEYHQALDVVIVGVVDGAMNRLGDTAHICFAVVSPTGKGSIRFQKVDVSIFGHFEPVDAMNELTPSQDLTDEALD